NSYGCHENYLVRRQGDFGRLADVLVPFLITRQVLTGAGKVLPTARGAMYCLSQRADHIWEGVSSATTRSRPIINTRDEPHADAEFYRRLHVIVGDSNMSEATALMKIGTVDLVLRMIEAGVIMRDMRMENPIRSIREISHDLSGRALVRLANGRQLTALEIQQEYLTKVTAFVKEHGPHNPHVPLILDLWERTLKAIESGDFRGIDTEIDWAIKKKLMDKYRERHGLGLDAPRIAQLDLTYHDISRSRGLYYLLQSRGAVRRIVDDTVIKDAVDVPPQTTRAKLRGDFVRRAQELGRDYTVDWVHLKLNDRAHQTILCKDPFRSVDERVDGLLDSMG
ncbi:MAG: Pup--protein ligase, partial [Arthrobacter sp.]|nr:Pup--protein ligase [Arthrobacter sp.]